MSDLVARWKAWVAAKRQAHKLAYPSLDEMPSEIVANAMMSNKSRGEDEL